MEVDSASSPPSDEAPRFGRQYQMDIASEGLRRNIIVKLDTGSGKTFIAAMIIKHFMANSRHSVDQGGQRCVFLVKNVPLVYQQAAEIRRCLATAHPDEIGEFIGNMGGEYIDIWTDDRWRQVFEKHRVLVMTADIFKDLLFHAKARPQWVSLLVLDECHHADKGDAYVAICKWLANKKSWDPSRLRLIGLTACLFSGNVKRDKLKERLEELQKTMLNSRIVTSTHSEAEGFRLRCKEETLLYSPMFSAEDEQCASITDPIYLRLSQALELAKQKLSDSKQSRNGGGGRGGGGGGHNQMCQASRMPGPSNGEPPLRKCQRALSDSLNALKDLGHFCCYRVMQLYVSELQDVERGTSGPIKQPERVAVQETLKVLLAASEEYKLIALTKQTPESLCSDKCLLLVESLVRHSNNLSDRDSFRAVIFTQERVIALAVKEFLCELTGFRSDLQFLRPDYVTGHGQSSVQSSEVAMSLSQQDRVLRQFRTGAVNTLVATRVIEEGMDVRQCSLVVKFHFPPEFRSYIQSKGRARAAESHYVLMINKDQENDCRAKLTYFKWLDYALRRELINMQAAFDDETEAKAEDSGTECTSRESDTPLDLSVPKNHPEFYEVASTGAKATLKTAVSLVNRYTTKLASVGCACPPPAHYDVWIDQAVTRYVCRLYLPRPCPLVHPVECRSGRLVANDAKRSAALEAVRQLHRLGELNDHLLPADRQARQPVKELRDYAPGQGTRSRRTWQTKSVARLSLAIDSIADSSVHVFFSHSLDVRLPDVQLPACDWQPAILTPNAPLPAGLSFPLYLGRQPVQFQPGVGQKLMLTPSQLASLVSAQAALTRLMLRHHSAEPMRGLEFELPTPMSNGNNHSNNENLSGHIAEPICQLVAVVRCGSADIDWDLLARLTSPNPATGPAIVKASDCALQPGVLVQRQKEQGSKSWHYVTSVLDDGLVEFCRTPHMDSLVYNPNAVKGKMSRLLARQNRPSMEHGKHLLAMPDVQIQLWCQLRALPAIVYRINQVLLGLELMTLLDSALTPICPVDATPKLKPPVIGALVEQLTAEERAMMKFDLMDSLIADGFRLPDFGSRLSLTSCLRAVTLTNANDFHSMELLETLGDSRLKLTVAARLFAGSDHTASEGNLTRLRTVQICNAFLHCAATEKGLQRFVFGQDANLPENYQPPCARPPDLIEDADADSRRWGYHLADKSLADVAEALTGLIQSACGGDAADAFLRWLGLPSASMPTPSEPACSTLLAPEAFGVNSEKFRHFWSMADLDRLQAKLGYAFQRKEFLLAAVTHSSFVWNHVTDCYQRLEFLGDAVIDYLVTQYAACDCMDTGSPGAITDLRMSLTNNDLFAAVAVANGLESHMLHFDDQLMSLIAEYRDSAAQLSGPDRYRQLSDRFVAGAAADASRVVRLSAVKALGDLVESLVGAVFADSGWSLATAWTLIRRLMSEPMRDFLTETPKNPVRQLHETAALLRRTAKFELVSTSIESMPPLIRMRLLVGNDGRFVYEQSERSKRLCRVALARQFLSDSTARETGRGFGDGGGGGKRKSPGSLSEESETTETSAEAAMGGVSCTAAPINIFAS